MPDRSVGCVAIVGQELHRDSELSRVALEHGWQPQLIDTLSEIARFQQAAGPGLIGVWEDRAATSAPCFLIGVAASLPDDIEPPERPAADRPLRFTQFATTYLHCGRGASPANCLRQAIVASAEQFAQQRLLRGVAQLEHRAARVLAAVYAGQRNSDIAGQLDVSLRTVESTRRQILNQLAIPSTLELIKRLASAGYPQSC